MSTQYNFTVAGANIEQIQYEVGNLSLSANPVQYIDYSDPNGTIFFTNTVTTPDMSTLATYLSNYLYESDSEFNLVNQNPFGVNINLIAGASTNRNYLIPDLSADDTFTMLARSQVLTNKVLNGNNNSFSNVPITTLTATSTSSVFLSNNSPSYSTLLSMGGGSNPPAGNYVVHFVGTLSLDGVLLTPLSCAIGLTTSSSTPIGYTVTTLTNNTISVATYNVAAQAYITLDGFTNVSALYSLTNTPGANTFVENMSLILTLSS